MAIRHLVVTKTNCGNCGKEYKRGYDIDQAEKTKHYLDLGDKLSLDERKKDGEWITIGTGYCPKCKTYIEAKCFFDGLKLMKVSPIPTK